MSGDLVIGQFILDKYTQLNECLKTLIQVYEMESGPERSALVVSLNVRTNHEGIHYTKEELTRLFLGRALIEPA